jgi:hemolysin activation/secretion protein
LGVVIHGATVIPIAQLTPIYSPFLTQQVSTTDLARIAERITARYREEGYFLSRATVPPQDDTGIARIVVHEGRIGEVVIEGDGAEQARPFMRGADNEPIARLSDLERRLALANDVPGLNVRSRMEPIDGDPEAHRLVVTAELDPLAAYAFADNRGSGQQRAARAYGRLAGASVLRDRDEAAIAILTSPEAPHEFAFAEASYAYSFENGGRLRVGFGISRSEYRADMLAADIGGDSQIVSLSYEFPLLRSRRTGLWLGAGFDALHQQNDWSDGSGAYADELRVARAALRGTLDEAGRSTTMVVQASFGLNMFGASQHSLMRRSRADADAEFVKLDGFVSHYRDLTEYLGLYVALAGQWSPEPLLGGEEFTAGGPLFGRAYGYGEISGDRGLAGVAELRAGFDPSGDVFSFLQGYLFVDAAHVWNEDAGSESLSSAGAGVRLTMDDWLTAGVEFARPLTRTPTDEDDRDWRQFFSLSAEY